MIEYTHEDDGYLYILPRQGAVFDPVYCAICQALLEKERVAAHIGWHRRTGTTL